MAIDKNVGRAGIVSSVNPASMTARVVFPDKDNLQSAELPILTMGALGSKLYWMPKVGDHVACLFFQNSSSLNGGVILGSYFTDENPPNAASEGVVRFDFSDGTVIEYNENASSLTINCAGTINITGGGDVVVGGVSLVNHTHGGIIPGGGSTAPPNK